MIKTSEKCYSIGDEIFHNDIDDFIDEFCESGIHTIFEGKKRKYAFSDFVNIYNIFDNAVEYASEEVGEASDDYMDYKYNDPKFTELRKSLNKTLNKWADENDLQPRFYGVYDIHEIKVKIDIEKSDYEIQPED